jgi:hypothetical protein
MLQWMQGYRGKSPAAWLLLGLAGLAYRNRWLDAAHTLGVTVWDDVVGWWLPLDHARYLLAVCRRRD